MDEKTAELRDIFVNVADEETVTESQEEARGSLTRSGNETDRLEAVIDAIRERYDVRSSLSTEDLMEVVKGFYDSDTDADIADALGVSPETVARARVDLHLVTDEDRDAPFDVEELRALREQEIDVASIADQFDASETTIRRYLHVIDVDEERRLIADRFRAEFERILTDGDLGERLTDDVKQTGLADAAEDIETNVSF